jgi:lysophospholipase L1-like esterase
MLYWQKMLASDGKKVFFLGSSVWYGYATGGVSCVEQLARYSHIIPVKEAVSGATIATRANKTNSYWERFNASLDNGNFANSDVLVIQLSSNDFARGVPKGCVSGSCESSHFDTAATCGALEAIIATAKETNPSVKIAVVTCCIRQDWKWRSPYADFIAHELAAIAEKWGIALIDCFNMKFTPGIHGDYLTDFVHPSDTGYFEIYTKPIGDWLNAG